MLRTAGGSLKTIVGAPRMFDVADPCVSWDAKSIVFSGVVHPDSNWRVFVVGVNGKELRQVTYTDRQLNLSQFGAGASLFERYDDFDPCWLPDGRIVFASTRHPAIASIGGVRASNLYVVNKDGTELHRITSERNGAEEPTIDPITGRVVFARWWLNIDRPNNVTSDGLTRDDKLALTTDNGNIWHAMSVNPDGNLLKLYAGFARTRYGMQTYKPSVMTDGRLLSTFTSNTSLVPSVGGTGIRWFKNGVDFEHYVIGVRSDESLRTATRIPPPYATDPIQLDKDAILFSYSSDGSDYGVYTCTLDGKHLRKIVDLPGTLELEPQLVKRQRVPPILPDDFPTMLSELPPTDDPQTYYVNDSFRFDCLNIFTNGAVDEPMPDAPKITKGAKIRFFINPQRLNVKEPDRPILIKTVDVFPRGGVHEPDVPADVSLFEQVVDSLGRVLETPSRSFAHVTGMNYERIGGGTKCVGCHVGHSVLTVPVNGSLAEWFNASTSAKVSASSSFIDANGRHFPPEKVVDRQARTGGDTVTWVAGEGEGASIGLSWDIPLEVRELVLYGIPRDQKSGTTIQVKKSEIFLYWNSKEVGRSTSSEAIRPEGTRIAISPTQVDSIRVVVTQFFGTVFGRHLAGWAEIETIARIP